MLGRNEPRGVRTRVGCGEARQPACADVSRALHRPLTEHAPHRFSRLRRAGCVRGRSRRPGLPRPSQTVLVVEVSQTSVAWDRQEKARIYAQWGAQTYWVVDLVADEVVVHTNPIPMGIEPSSFIVAMSRSRSRKSTVPSRPLGFFISDRRAQRLSIATRKPSAMRTEPVMASMVARIRGRVRARAARPTMEA